MDVYDIVVLITTLLTLGGVGFIIMKLPRTHLRTKGRALLVDTSVLMDGRIVAVAKTGFIGDTLVIPRSVVGELQFLADHADSEKRARARYGLDVVTELQGMDQVDVELLQDGSKAREGVDDRLLSLAKQHGAWILTIDYNLNKVAAVEGIGVLNINELAQSIRMAHLPGEHLMLELMQKGQDAHQAIGHLSDGTMVVVEQASNQIGRTVEVEIVRNLQTAAGKMIFARIFKESPAVSQNNQVTLMNSKSKKVKLSPSRKQSSSVPGREASARQQTSKKSKETANDKRSIAVSALQLKSTNTKSARKNNKPTKITNSTSSTSASRSSRSNNRNQRRNSKLNHPSSSRRIDHEAVLLDLVERQ